MKLEEVESRMPLIDYGVIIREILEGDFTEGSEVLVNINGHIIKRKVFWDGKAKDLYVVYKGARYFYCEFWDKL